MWSFLSPPHNLLLLSENAALTRRAVIKSRRLAMRILPTTLLVLALLVQVAFALDITTADGQTYKQCAVTGVEPDALRITHADGATRIPYEKLPPALQRQYFDPTKVGAYRQQAEDARKAAEAKAAQAERERLLEQARQAEDARAAEAKAAQAERERLSEQARQAEDVRKAAAAKAAEEKRLHNEAEAKAAQAERERLSERARQKQEQARQKQERGEAREREDRERKEAKQRKKPFRVVAIIAGIVVGLFLYFIPSIVGRHKTNAGAIFVLNFLLGWSFLGWVLALVWACTKDSAMDTLAQQQMNTPRERGRYLE